MNASIISSYSADSNINCNKNEDKKSENKNFYISPEARKSAAELPLKIDNVPQRKSLEGQKS